MYLLCYRCLKGLVLGAEDDGKIKSDIDLIDKILCVYDTTEERDVRGVGGLGEREGIAGECQVLAQDWIEVGNKWEGWW